MRQRRDTRRRLDQFIANPRCEANVLSAVHDIPMTKVAAALGVDAPFGQSPFAFQRGLGFERSLYADDATRLRAALVDAGVLPISAEGFVDLRLRKSGGPMRDLDDACARFAELLGTFASADPAARAALPAIIAAPALRIPGRAILPDGLFAVDVVTVHPHPRPRRIELRVGEIKVYPDRGGYTDPHELASTRAQAGIYVHALRLAVDAAGVGGAIEIADQGFLVLSKPGRNFPSVRAREDLRWQAERAAAAFERLREAAARAVPLDGDDADDAVPTTRLAVVQDAAKAYDESCIGFCELAPHCHARAVAASDPAVLGGDVARFLGTILLSRAVELLDGGAAANDAENDFVRRVAEARSVAGAAS